MAQGIYRASNIENIHKEVQHICVGTLDQFVPEPPKKYVQTDLIISLRRFKNVFWWKEFWQGQKQETKH